MKEPRRLREEPQSYVERALLGAGTSYRGSDELRQSTLIALGISGTTLTCATSASALSSTLSRVGWWKAAVAVSAVGAMATIPVVYQSWSDTTVEVSHAPAVRTSAKPPPAVETTSVAPETLPVEEAVTAVGGAPGTGAERVVRVRVGRADRSAIDLRLELEALDGARARLADGEPTRALGLLDNYARSYPQGRLGLEAEVLRIDALAKSGQREMARKRAEAFLRRHPNSVLASRVRGAVGDSRP
jgi:hypothetical protein